MADSLTLGNVFPRYSLLVSWLAPLARSTRVPIWDIPTTVAAHVSIIVPFNWILRLPIVGCIPPSLIIGISPAMIVLVAGGAGAAVRHLGVVRRGRRVPYTCRGHLSYLHRVPRICLHTIDCIVLWPGVAPNV